MNYVIEGLEYLRKLVQKPVIKLTSQERRIVYLNALFEDGYLEPEKELDSIYKDAEKAYNSILKNEKYVIDFLSRDYYIPGSHEKIDLLPGLIEHAPFELDMNKIAIKMARYYDKRFLRYFNALKEHLSESEMYDIINRMNAEVLQRYYDRVLGTNNKTDKLIFEKINDRSTCFPLNVISFTDKDRANIFKDFDRYKYLFDDETIESDKIISVRRIDRFIGSCDDMEYYHDQFLEGRTQAGLITLNGIIVASMKMNGQPSILGLRNVKDSKGRYPIVNGGVYGTTTKFIRIIQDEIDDKCRSIRFEFDQIPIFPIRMMGHIQSDPNSTRKYVDKVRKLRDSIK